MECEEYEKMFLLEGSYWWFVGRRHILTQLLGQIVGTKEGMEVLEVGCGTGGNLAMLSGFGRTVGLDLPGTLRWCAKREFPRLVASRAEALACRAGAFDLVVCLDVLEHIEDDLVALREMLRVCRSGGHVLLTVPAYRFLWSEHDDALGHRRRYDRKQLARLVTAAGFEPLRLSYAITSLFPPILFFRLGQRLVARLRGRRRPAVAYVQVPKPLSLLFVSLLRFEAWLLRRIDLPFGVSLVCLARKSGETDKRSG